MTQDRAEESQPMTRFQKVASALRGDKPDQDAAEAENDHDYWDDKASAEEEDRPVAVTRPDGLGAQAPDEADVPRPAADDYQTTQPDMFGTTAHADPGETPVPAGAVTPVVDPGTVAPEAVAPRAVPETEVPEAGTSIAEVGVAETGAAEMPVAGRHAADGPMAGELRPGEAADLPGDFSDIAYGNLIPEAGQFREQWQQIQFKFVDDPRASVTEAADVVAQVTARLEAAIQERQRIITERQRSLRSRWDEGSSADTEALRGTLRMYRSFLDQLLGSR